MKAKHNDDLNTSGFQQMRLAKYRGQLGDRGTDEEMYNVEEENKLVSTFLRADVILKMVSSSNGTRGGTYIDVVHE